MSLPAVITGKIGKLIPRLGTDHTGEIVAVVGAIARTLKGVGCDWHDLAAALESPEPRRARDSDPAQRPWSRWTHLAANERVMALDAIRTLRLSPWERGFIDSIDRILLTRPHARLSAKQEQVLDRLLSQFSNSEGGL